MECGDFTKQLRISCNLRRVTFARRKRSNAGRPIKFGCVGIIEDAVWSEIEWLNGNARTEGIRKNQEHFENLLRIVEIPE